MPRRSRSWPSYSRLTKAEREADSAPPQPVWRAIPTSTTADAILAFGDGGGAVGFSIAGAAFEDAWADFEFVEPTFASFLQRKDLRKKAPGPTREERGQRARPTCMCANTTLPSASPRFYLFTFLLLALFFVHAPTASLHAALALKQPQQRPLPFDPYSGPCLASQLALERAGQLKAASQTPFEEASAHPLAIIMALHPPGFRQAAHTLVTLAATRPWLGWAVFFVFSNAEHAGEFRSFLSSTLARPDLLPLYRALDLSHDKAATSWIAAGPKGTAAGLVASVKTLHAWAVVGACYKLLTQIDNEVEWLRPREFLGTVRSLAAARTVYAAYAPRFRPINEHSTAHFTEAHKAALVGPSRSLQLFSWFSNPQVVLGGDVGRYLAYARYPARRVSHSTREFSYVGYEWWKVARGEWEVVDATPQLEGAPYCGSLETISTRGQYEALVRDYPPGPRWTSKAFCTVNQGVCENSTGLVLLIHVDRSPEVLAMSANADCGAPM